MFSFYTFPYLHSWDGLRRINARYAYGTKVFFFFFSVSFLCVHFLFIFEYGNKKNEIEHLGEEKWNGNEFSVHLCCSFCFFFFNYKFHFKCIKRRRKKCIKQHELMAYHENRKSAIFFDCCSFHSFELLACGFSRHLKSKKMLCN